MLMGWAGSLLATFCAAGYYSGRSLPRAFMIFMLCPKGIFMSLRCSSLSYLTVYMSLNPFFRKVSKCWPIFIPSRKAYTSCSFF